jgi:hypothetical protein
MIEGKSKNAPTIASITVVLSRAKNDEEIGLQRNLSKTPSLTGVWKSMIGVFGDRDSIPITTKDGVR